MTGTHINPLGHPLADWQPPPWPEHRSLVGDTVRLEPLQVHHGDALFRAFSADESGACWTYLPYGPFSDAADLEQWFAQNSRATDPQFAWGFDPRACGARRRTTRDATATRRVALSALTRDPDG